MWSNLGKAGMSQFFSKQEAKGQIKSVRPQFLRLPVTEHQG